MFTVNRASTKRLKLLVDMLNSEHLISGQVEVARNNAIALFKNDEEIFSFCIDEFLDAQVIDLCNAIITIYDCVEDSFAFKMYLDFYTRTISFGRRSDDGIEEGFSIELNKFADNLIELEYRKFAEELEDRVYLNKQIRFENLEQLSEEVYRFLDKIEFV